MKASYENAKAEKSFLRLAEDPSGLPICFTYGGREYVNFKGLARDSFTVAENGGRTDATSVFTLPDGLTVSVLASFYRSHGVTEWTVWFENRGSGNSEIIENVFCRLEFEGERPQLKGILGDLVNQYRPYCCELSCAPAHFCCDSGRATHIKFPYFNLEYGDQGCMLAIGWAGSWTADFSSDGQRTEYVARSVNRLHTYLKPGEKIRTALFVAAPYTIRNEDYAANFWRSWFIAHNLPRANAEGEELKPFSTACLALDTGLPNSDGSISERFSTWRPSMEKMLQEGVKVDFRWFDAGWYIAPDGSSPVSQWWSTVGTWVLDPVKWPGDSFRQSTDFAREHGMKTLMWFEPERVTSPELLEQNYGYNADWAIRVENEKTISNNIGIPECLEWTTRRICKVLRENRVEMYREDNNCNAAKLWRHLDANEGEGREGITECRFIMAHYKMWDDIIACTESYGGCAFVDSCASGGGRNDLESMRRGVPILRSDSDRTTISLRLSMTTAFNKWIPFCGANTREKESQLAEKGKCDEYTWRASYLPILNVDAQYVHDDEKDFPMLRFGLEEWKKISPLLLKDFYLHTPWHSEKDNYDFTAYSYFDPEKAEGALFVFRMENCGESEVTLKLQYAQKGKKYRVADADGGEFTADGEKLAGGYVFSLPHARCAKLFTVKEL